MLIIGLTGGIGTGKSTVAGLFSALGVPIIDADQLCKQLTRDPASHLVKQIFQHFGQDFADYSGKLDRKKLQHFVFNQPAEKKWLENLLHPVIYFHIQKQLAEIHHQSRRPAYIMLMIPLLFETTVLNFMTMIHRTLVMDLPEETQIQRVKARDGLSIVMIQKIIKSQCPRKKRLEKADDVIVNTDLHTIKKQVLMLHQQYLHLSKNC